MKCGLIQRVDAAKTAIGKAAADAAEIARLKALAAAGASASSTHRKIKMSHFINQLRDDEMPILEAGKIAAAYAIYDARLGGAPPPDEECTSDQLSALDSLFKEGLPPYVDMAIWGPYGTRLLRTIKMVGMQIMPNGQLERVELKGPSNYTMWQQCYAIFRTGCIMLDQISPSTLDKYSKMIQKYTARFGHSAG